MYLTRNIRLGQIMKENIYNIGGIIKGYFYLYYFFKISVWLFGCNLVK